MLSLKEFKELRNKTTTDPYLLVIDGDWLVYQSMIVSEEETDWGDNIWTLICDHNKALNVFNNLLISYRTRKKVWINSPVVLAFMSLPNWRNVLVTKSYKENRKSIRKPVGYNNFINTLSARDDFFCIKEDLLEGDDVMGIIGSNAKSFNADKVVLVSCDKDFKTIPYCDFLWCTTGNILSHTLQQADWWHMFQTMKGDIVDNYKGIQGWGDTSADFLDKPYYVTKIATTIKSGKNKGQEKVQWRKTLKGAHSLWDCIVSLATKANMTTKSLIEQARLSRILRYTDYDINSKYITLWNPTMCSLQ